MRFVLTPEEPAKGAAYWSGMASCVATHLERVLKEGRTLPNEIRKGWHTAAGRFFAAVIAPDDVKGIEYHDRQQHREWRRLAAQTLEELKLLEPYGPAYDALVAGDGNPTIRSFDDLLPVLTEDRQLTEAEAATATTMITFLRRIITKGDDERYREMMDGSHRGHPHF